MELQARFSTELEREKLVSATQLGTWDLLPSLTEPVWVKGEGPRPGRLEGGQLVSWAMLLTCRGL